MNQLELEERFGEIVGIQSFLHIPAAIFVAEMARTRYRDVDRINRRQIRVDTGEYKRGYTHTVREGF